MKTVLEILTAALHHEANIPESDAYRIARKLLSVEAQKLVVARRNDDDVRARIVAEYNRINVDAMARKYRLNRSTIYRIVAESEPHVRASILAEYSGNNISELARKYNRAPHIISRIVRDTDAEKEVRASILAEYNGKNAHELARKYKRHPSTINRIVCRKNLCRIAG